MGAEKREPEVVVRNGKPVAVIIGIDEYREMLERLEDAEACTMLERLRSQPMEFRRFDEFLAEYGSNV